MKDQRHHTLNLALALETAGIEYRVFDDKRAQFSVPIPGTTLLAKVDRCDCGGVWFTTITDVDDLSVPDIEAPALARDSDIIGYLQFVMGRPLTGTISGPVYLPETTAAHAHIEC